MIRTKLIELAREFEPGMGKGFRFPRNSVFHFPFSAEKIRDGKFGIETEQKPGLNNSWKNMEKKSKKILRCFDTFCEPSLMFMKSAQVWLGQAAGDSF